MMVHYKKYKVEHMYFYFCNNDIKWCIKDTKQKWVKSKLDVSNIWPMKIGTNLLQLANLSPRRLFKSKVSFDVASYLTPTFLDDHPNIKSGNNIQRNKKAPTIKYSNDCALLLF